MSHSEGTEPSDPSSPAALLGFAVATRQYTAPAPVLKPWRLPAELRAAPPAPVNHGDHAAHAGQMEQVDHSQHAGNSPPAAQMDDSQHAGHSMPVEVEVQKPAADAHQGH